MGVYFDNHMDHTYTFCGYNSVCFNADQWPLYSKGLIIQPPKWISNALPAPNTICMEQSPSVADDTQVKKLSDSVDPEGVLPWPQATALTTTRSLRQYRKEPMGGIHVMTLAGRSYTGIRVPLQSTNWQPPHSFLIQPALRNVACCSRTSQRGSMPSWMEARY